MNSFLFFGLVILGAIILVYFISYWWNNGELPEAPFKESMTRMKNSVSSTYDSYFTSAADMYEKTVGYINDDAAKMALDKSLQKDKMYTRNEKLGNLSDKTTADAAATSFMIADLYRFNIAPNANVEDAINAEATAAAQYAAAMRRVAMNPIGAVNTLDMHMPPAEFMIDRAEDFYEDFIARQTLQNDINGDTNEDNMAILQQRFNLPNLVQLRNDVRQARLAVANIGANNGTAPRRPIVRRRKTKNGHNPTPRELTRDLYFEEREIRNDPQNVHESQVNNDMMRVYRNILAKNDRDDGIVGGTVNHAANIAELRQYANNYKYTDPKQKERVMKTINKMAEGNYITSLNAKENEILSNVWKRTNSLDNEANRENLRTALITGLADCVEAGYNGTEYQVCASGRTGRVLGSMTLLDADENISEPIKTAEVLRNEVFAKSYKIIQDALKETDDETARGYNGALESPAPDVDMRVKQFEDTLRNRIAFTLRAEYEGKVDSHVLENLVKDAQAGV